MLVQKIGVYTNQYSINKNRQSKKTSSPAFGMKINCNIVGDISSTNKEKIIMQAKLWGKGMAARIERVLVTNYPGKKLSVSSEDLNRLNELDLTVESSSVMPRISAKIQDKNNPEVNCEHSVIFNNDEVSAALTAVNNTMEDCARIFVKKIKI